MGEASSERVKATDEEIATMQRLIREAMYDGALGFDGAEGPRRPGRACVTTTSAGRFASVLGDLGTGVFQAAYAPGGTKQTRAVARELAARTGRPSIYNLMSDPIGNPDEWVEHMKWLEDGFKGIALLRLCPVDRRGCDLQPRARAQRAAGRRHHRSARLLPRHADLGPGHGPALPRP